MATEAPLRYYRPRSDFTFDIRDIENFVYDMSRCIKCKGCTWVDHTYMPGAKFTTRCPSAAKYEFDAYGAYGKMRIGHAMAEGALDWTGPSDSPRISEKVKSYSLIYTAKIVGDRQRLSWR